MRELTNIIISNFEKILPMTVVLISFLAGFGYLLKMRISTAPKPNLLYDALYWFSAALLTVAVVLKKG
jgi:hypothetical protein